MKKVFIVASLSSMLIPAHAWAELNYNVIDINYLTTNYSNADPSLFQVNFGISKKIFRNMYFATSFGSATQEAYSNSGSKKIKSISIGAGYYTPLYDKPKTKVDMVVKGNIVAGTAKVAGSSFSANGYDIGTGVRAQFAHGLESSLSVIHARKSNGTYTDTNTFLNVQLGFNFTPKVQMAVGMDFHVHDQSMNMGMRFFF